MVEISDADSKKYDRFRDSYARQYGEWQKVLNTLVSMATALIALPILFFKDIFREVVGTGGTILSLIVQQDLAVVSSILLSWLCLLASIGLSLFFNVIYGSFQHGLYKYNYPPDFLDAPEGQKLRASMLQIFKYATVFFGAGFVLMMLFALTYVRITVDGAVAK